MDQKLLQDALVGKKIITKKQLQGLLDESKRTGVSFEDLLIDQAIRTEEELVKLKGEILHLQYIDLEKKEISKDILNIIPKKVAENYKIVAFDKVGRSLSVAFIDPQNYKAIEAIEFLAQEENLKIKYFITSLSGYHKVYKQYGELAEEAEEALAGVSSEVIDTEKGTRDEELQGVIKSAPVSKMVMVIIRHAIDGRASDIHIEPQIRETRIRYRVDGMLHTSLVLPKYIHSAIIARIKVLANLKLDETRKPQDGRIRLLIEGRDIDFRISTLPLFEGEKVVMRVLDVKAQTLSLEKLGFSTTHIRIIEANIKKTHGMVLLTGPTGSGKTTTLYTILGVLNKEGINIITLEDPIEYYIDGINQSQINPEVGYTFASGLRSILRQDPNIIMLGEIRDQESAELVIHAGLTGHMVLSTLHTNNSIGAIPRLLDMNVEPFLLSSTINVVIAQRLARRICPDCIAKAEIPKEVLGPIEAEIDQIPKAYRDEYKIKKPYTFYKGMGCTRCGNQGYHGRVVVAEAINFTQELLEIVGKGFRYEDATKELERQQFVTLRQDSLCKAVNGAITLEEVFRVTQL